MRTKHTGSGASLGVVEIVDNLQLMRPLRRASGGGRLKRGAQPHKHRRRVPLHSMIAGIPPGLPTALLQTGPHTSTRR